MRVNGRELKDPTERGQGIEHQTTTMPAASSCFAEREHESSWTIPLKFPLHKFIQYRCGTIQETGNSIDVAVCSSWQGHINIVCDPCPYKV